MPEGQITIEFVLASGKVLRLVGEEGETVRDLAVHNDVRGILGECGGNCSCGTCHVVVDERWIDVVQRVKADSLEDGLLDIIADRQANSRLSCQIPISPALNGLRVRVVGD